MLKQLRVQDGVTTNIEKEDLANQIVEMENHLNQAKHNDLYTSKMELTKSQFVQKPKNRNSTITAPMILNLNEDPLLSETIFYYLD